MTNTPSHRDERPDQESAEIDAAIAEVGQPSAEDPDDGGTAARALIDRGGWEWDTPARRPSARDEQARTDEFMRAMDALDASTTPAEIAEQHALIQQLRDAEGTIQDEARRLERMARRACGRDQKRCHGEDNAGA
ncbi:hypothetical protein [Cellulosimicrobium sp. CpK407]|uniref:hypothetical protein n=1 Tax=Cellulosimicrobium sp. CpK407 TaxID=3229847 RepID=UPI003F3872BB